MKSVLIILMMLLPLSGCGAIPSKPNYSMTAPDVQEYSDEQQDKMADQMEKGHTPDLNAAMDDYSVERDQSRVLKKQR